MNTVIRAKIKIDRVITHPVSDINEPSVAAKTGEQISAMAVYSEDKTTENYSFSAATPSLSLQMYISNPEAFGKLVQGKEYYLDFIPVEDRTVGRPCSHPMESREMGSPVDRSETCGVCGMMRQDIVGGRVGWFDPKEDRTVGPANEEARQQFIAAQSDAPDEPKRCIHGEYITRCPLHGGRP